jgi:hypothetical protein
MHIAVSTKLPCNYEIVVRGGWLGSFVRPLNYADSQPKMEQGKARHDVVEAAARALAA